MNRTNRINVSLSIPFNLSSLAELDRAGGTSRNRNRPFHGLGDAFQ